MVHACNSCVTKSLFKAVSASSAIVPWQLRRTGGWPLPETSVQYSATSNHMVGGKAVVGRGYSAAKGRYLVPNGGAAAAARASAGVVPSSRKSFSDCGTATSLSHPYAFKQITGHVTALA
jgi:hypothetical protein